MRVSKNAALSLTEHDQVRQMTIMQNISPKVSQKKGEVV
jgi:hypothetical protein